MTEAQWVSSVAEQIEQRLVKQDGSIRVKSGLRLAYGHEIAAYDSVSIPDVRTSSFQTDLALIEVADDGVWRPRVVVEAKMFSVTTHDAMTYSHKAAVHRSVYPYLRYGIMLGNRGHHPLPGRLYRHGAHFDFMISFEDFELSRGELSKFAALLLEEVNASRTMEKILFESRRAGRDRYTVLHRKLSLE